MEITQYHIIKKVLVLLPFYLFTFLPLSAQTFTQQVQTQHAGEGKVTIYQDATIDQLINGAQVYQQPVSNRQQRQDQQTPASNGHQNHEQTSGNQSQGQPQTETAGEQQEEQVQTGGQRHRIVGYRVQAFSGGNTRQDRMKAEQAGNSISQLFPGIYVEVHFYSPSWKCRVGNYRTYEEAKQMRDEIRRMGYPSATIVKGKITVTD